MRVNTRILLAAGCVSLVALSVPAFSRPLSNGHSDVRAKAARSAPVKRVQSAAPNPHKRQTSTHALRRQPASAAATSYASVAPARKPLFGWPTLVAEARKYMGTNPTARSRLWCATFMNMVLAKAGYSGTNSDAARSFASYGRRISEPKVGAIAVLTRGKRGGHVGVVSGIDKHGNPVIISGNHNKLVGEAIYPRSRVIAYVMPTEHHATPVTRIASRAPSAASAVSGQPTMVRAGSGSGIDSPIHELIAAIEAEQARAERVRPAPPPVQAAAPRPPMPPAQPQVQPRPQRVVEQLSAAPHRVVQQTAEVPRMQRRDAPLDPALANFLGLRQSRPGSR